MNDVQQNQGLIIMLSTNTGPGSGKTTAASFLHELNPTAVIVSFAYPLKTMLKELLYLWTGSEQESYEMVYGSLKETVIDGMGYDITPRKLMQTLGTEWREMIDKDLWVKLAILETEKHLLAGRTVLIDDLRFPHELELFRSHKWMCKTTVLHVNIDRPVGSALFAGVEGQLFIHKSEGGLRGVTPDYQINNTGTKSHLLEQIERLVMDQLQ